MRIEKRRKNEELTHTLSSPQKSNYYVENDAKKTYVSTEIGRTRS